MRGSEALFDAYKMTEDLGRHICTRVCVCGSLRAFPNNDMHTY